MKTRHSVFRALTVLGAICRNHEIDDKSSGDTSSDPDSGLTWENLPSRGMKMFLKYLDKSDPKTKCLALRALSDVFVAWPRLMLQLDGTGLITSVMDASQHRDLQVQALSCWCDILLVS